MEQEKNIGLNERLEDSMSFFYAPATPMLNVGHCGCGGDGVCIGGGCGGCNGCMGSGGVCFGGGCGVCMGSDGVCIIGGCGGCMVMMVLVLVVAVVVGMMV